MQFHRRSGVVALTVCALAIGVGGALAQPAPKYLYTLSNFVGPFRYDGVRLDVDPVKDEVYFVYQDLVRIFNSSGMEVFSFGDDLGLGQIVDAGPDPSGDIIVLSFKDGRSVVTRCNFRGVPVRPIEVSGLPAGVTFSANRLQIRNGLLYFADLAAMRVVITGLDGRCVQVVDFKRLIGTREVERAGGEMFGFTVDRDGSLLATIPTLFKVFKLAPDGALSSFGRAGSSAGRFGIVSGVAVDSRGDVLVTDKLRSVVMVFDKDFNFLAEFGYRGAGHENLIVPDDLVIDRADRVYVSQGRRRGVSVFTLWPQ